VCTPRHVADDVDSGPRISVVIALASLILPYENCLERVRGRTGLQHRSVESEKLTARMEGATAPRLPHPGLPDLGRANRNPRIIARLLKLDNPTQNNEAKEKATS
jgi:hypothetical protein